MGAPHVIWLFIALVVLVALAPLTHFIPTKAQRRINALRDLARAQGYQVEFRKLPGHDPDFRPSPPGLIFYGRRRRQPDSRRRPGGRHQYLRQGQEWLRREGGFSAMDTRIEALPEAILAAEIDAERVGVYWLEEGDAATLEQIAVALAGMEQALEERQLAGL